MNSKWAYKGYLHGIKMTIVEGKGMTVKNDILYKTKEFEFLHQFKKLTFQIEKYTSSNEYNIINSKNSQNSSYYSEDINVINEIKENNSKSIKEEEENLKEDENLNIKNIEEKYASDISNKIIINETSINKNTNVFTNKNSTIYDNYTLNKENDKNKILKKEFNNNNINSNISDKNFDKINLEKNNNNCNNSTYFKINEHNNNLKNMINYNFSNNNNSNNYSNNNNNNTNNIIKKIQVKQNLNNKRYSKNPKAVYYGNARQYIQNVEGNETNNTNIDFNIVIDKQKSNCCDNCIDYQQATQVCFIF
jgi:SWI/SNF-related matrix-associated actin-dependent regulator of chromatin subfamily A protein 2/4